MGLCPPEKSEMTGRLPTLKTHVKCHHKATRGQVPALPLSGHVTLGNSHKLSPSLLTGTTGIVMPTSQSCCEGLATGCTWFVHHKRLKRLLRVTAPPPGSQPKTITASFNPHSNAYSCSSLFSSLGAGVTHLCNIHLLSTLGPNTHPRC